jgi:RNA binding exosome subunit
MYVEKYGQHTEAEMQEMLNLKFKVAKNRLKLEEKYYKKIQKQVDMESAVRFVQVQDFIQSAIRFELLSELPVLPRAAEKAAMMEGAGANQTPASNTSQMRKD